MQRCDAYLVLITEFDGNMGKKKEKVKFAFTAETIMIFSLYSERAVGRFEALSIPFLRAYTHIEK